MSAEIDRLRAELQEATRLHFAAHQRAEQAEALAKLATEANTAPISRWLELQTAAVERDTLRQRLSKLRDLLILVRPFVEQDDDGNPRTGLHDRHVLEKLDEAMKEGS